MVGRTNVGGGIGLPAWAYIGVTYPADSVCTATNGLITLTADGTSGKYVFGIPEPLTESEDWTVSCTDGERSRTETVTLSSQYEFATVQLIYSRLPVGYQEVEYLEATGTQYINIGAIDNFPTYEIDLTYLNYANAGELPCGASGQAYVWLGIYDNSSHGLVYRYGQQIASRKTVNTKITVVVNDASNQIVEDGVVLGTATLTSGNYRFGLFCVSQGSTVGNISRARIYACTIIDKSTASAVYDFVPCYRMSDSVAGFYDMANNEFLTNDGTGTFIVGENV